MGNCIYFNKLLIKLITLRFIRTCVQKDIPDEHESLKFPFKVQTTNWVLNYVFTTRTKNRLAT